MRVRDRFGDAMLLVLPMEEGSMNQARNPFQSRSNNSSDICSLVLQDSRETSLTPRTVK